MNVSWLRRFDAILLHLSGGKDSQAMLDHVAHLAARAGVLDRIWTLHCRLGQAEWPGTAALGPAYVARYGDRPSAADLARVHAEHYAVPFAERHRRQGDLLAQVRARGMWPSARARYCSSDQKRGPGRRYITELVNQLAVTGRPAQLLNCLGLRAAESRARAHRHPLQRDDAASSGRREVMTWLPIHSWSTEDVWARIRASGLPYHWAYDAGMSRVSCTLCVLASRADLIRGAQLRPDLAGEYHQVEREIGHRFRVDCSMAELLAAAGVPTAGRAT